MSTFPVGGSNGVKEKKRALEMLRRIDDLLDSGEYDWCEDTLSGIRETIEKKEFVTEGQERAVNNIDRETRS